MFILFITFLFIISSFGFNDLDLMEMVDDYEDLFDDDFDDYEDLFDDDFDEINDFDNFAFDLEDDQYDYNAAKQTLTDLGRSIAKEKINQLSSYLRSSAKNSINVVPLNKLINRRYKVPFQNNPFNL
ncbi:hypothetical protein EDI_272910 [Entamoeba dispar SAW760]|uniref:Uncharacterized protein n=1 Tax=Entamoeba dispar (strain ATCC PRA-260 / SAW760) TaxID=370354 RepID=B0EU39_ENTDS|nr:uncharacterized protein EDI_272910 [Entamoeba dispar SAW760]EDR21956.1 hypothetical protein EDI_272910 [Entamoeba dispar SAW760]|eukprot:EDR21956.1 hypothetical protein EDI_272910 [Entamoeba dispar SAW760]